MRTRIHYLGFTAALLVSLGCSGALTPNVETIPLTDESPITVPKPTSPAEELSVKALQAWMMPADLFDDQREFQAESIHAQHKQITEYVQHHQLLPHEEMLVDAVREAVNYELDLHSALEKVVRDIKPKAPVDVDVKTADWRIALTYQYAYGTSEDWNHWSYNILYSAQKANIATVQLNFGQTQVVLKKDGKPLHTLTVPESVQAYGNVGYLFVKKGKEPEVAEHDIDITVLEKASDYFGTTLSPQGPF